MSRCPGCGYDVSEQLARWVNRCPECNGFIGPNTCARPVRLRQHRLRSARLVAIDTAIMSGLSMGSAAFIGVSKESWRYDEWVHDLSTIAHLLVLLWALGGTLWSGWAARADRRTIVGYNPWVFLGVLCAKPLAFIGAHLVITWTGMYV